MPRYCVVSFVCTNRLLCYCVFLASGEFSSTSVSVVVSLFYLVHCTALRQRASKGEALEGVGKLHCFVDIAVETPSASNFALLVAFVIEKSLVSRLLLFRQRSARSSPVIHVRRSSVVAEVSVIWLILPVVICLSQRLSHACLSISTCTVKLRMAH